MDERDRLAPVELGHERVEDGVAEAEPGRFGKQGHAVEGQIAQGAVELAQAHVHVRQGQDGPGRETGGAVRHEGGERVVAASREVARER